MTPVNAVFSQWLSDLEWSTPIPFDGGRTNGLPRYGVYRQRLVDGYGNPIPIRRLNGEDKEGIFYVGSTPTSAGRLAQRFDSEQRPYLKARIDKSHNQYPFWRELRDVYGNTAGILFEYIAADYWQARIMEIGLQGEYVMRFLEIPESGPLKPQDDDPCWPLHNANHVWRRWLREQALQR